MFISVSLYALKTFLLNSFVSAPVEPSVCNCSCGLLAIVSGSPTCPFATLGSAKSIAIGRSAPGPSTHGYHSYCKYCQKMFDNAR